MRRRARAAAVGVLAAAVGSGATAAMAASGTPAASGAAAGSPAGRATLPVPRHSPRHLLRHAHELHPRGELASRRASRLATLAVLEKRAPRPAWGRAFAAARSYARRRLGRVSFALVDDTGRVRGWHGRQTHYSASLVKAMLLVAYLRRHGVRERHLSSSARALLHPMIERSDNDAASRMLSIVGYAGLERLARRVGMRWFATTPAWGDTHLAAIDQAIFFYGIDRFVPPRHRAYARTLLSHIIPEQRWGVPEVVPRGRGLRVFFKGGWRPSAGGWIENQSALIVAPGGRRIALSVLTDHDRSDGYGHETIRGVARRLMRPLSAK